MLARLAILISLLIPTFAQSACDNTPAYSPCEFVFELTAAEAATHPDPYQDVELQAEIRSPHFRTFLIPADWDGGHKMVLRFVPIESGPGTYKITSKLAGADGQPATCKPPEADAPGYA